MARAASRDIVVLACSPAAPNPASRPAARGSWTWGMPGHERSSSRMTGTPASRRRSVPCSGWPDPGHPLRRSGAANEFDHGTVDWQLPA